MSQVDSADNPARSEGLSCFWRGSPACQRIESARLPPLCFRCRPTCALATATGLVPSLAQLSGRGHPSITFQRKRLGLGPKRFNERKATPPSGRAAQGASPGRWRGSWRGRPALPPRPSGRAGPGAHNIRRLNPCMPCTKWLASEATARILKGWTRWVPRRVCCPVGRGPGSLRCNGQADAFRGHTPRPTALTPATAQPDRPVGSDAPPGL